jgi:hypothetical protein
MIASRRSQTFGSLLRKPMGCVTRRPAMKSLALYVLALTGIAGRRARRHRRPALF